MQKLLAEFLGTFFLVFIGTGAVAANSLGAGIGLVGIALCFGLVVSVLVYSLGPVSGCHINPAMTLSFLFLKKIDSKQALEYLAAQFLGATVASLFVLAIFGSAASLGATVPATGDAPSFALETIFTFFLAFTVFETTSRNAFREFAGLSIGASVAIAAMVAGSISGASLNPARSFGPAVVGGIYDSFWIYLSAPVLGALLAAVAYRKINGLTEK